jgi:hypothetical protein
LSNAPGIRWAGSLLALSLVIFAVNMGKILSHFVRPRIAPFALKTAVPVKNL